MRVFGVDDERTDTRRRCDACVGVPEPPERGHVRARLALHRGTPRPLGGDQVSRQLHLGHAARHEQPAVVSHYTNARPPRAEQRRDAIGNRFDLDVDMPDERSPQRMAHLVQTPDLCPATLFGVDSQRCLVRLQDLDTSPSHFVAQACGIHRLLAGRKDGVEVIGRCAAFTRRMGRRGERLGGGGDRGQRRDAMPELHSQPPLLQPLLKHARDIKSQTVGEHQAGLGLCIHTRDQLAVLGLTLGGKLLKLAGGFVQPRCVERPHHLGDECIVRGRFRMVHRVQRSAIAAPTIRGVVCRHRRQRYAAQRRARQGCEPGQRFQCVRHHAVAEIRPNPGSPIAVLCLQLENTSTQLLVRHGPRRLQRVPELSLLLVVHLRLARPVDQQITRPGMAKQFGDARVAPRGVAESAPDVLPLAIAVEHQVARPCRAVLVGVEPKHAGADVPERLPPRRVAASLERFRLRHPAQQIADGIAHRKAVEVVRIESAPSERRNGLGGQHRQCAHQRLAGSHVQRQVEAQRHLGRHERLHRPIPAVLLVPHRAAVLKLDQRVERIGAVSAGAQFLPADSGQVQDGHSAGRWHQVGQRPVDKALEPDSRPRAARGVVGAEHVEMGTCLLQRRREGAPLPVGIRPQQRDRFSHTFRRARGRGKRCDERIEQSLRVTARSIHCSQPTRRAISRHSASKSS